MEWISVKDRLPEKNTEVLIYDVYCGILIGWLDKYSWSCEYLNDLEVTHWMPLPEPPKGE